MKKIVKYSTFVFLFLLTSTMFAAIVNAQDQPTEEIPIEQFPQVPNPNVTPPPPATGEVANVVVAASAGGTTDPAPGAYEYAYASTITITATPNEGYRFLYWTISGSYAPGHNQPPINYPENAAEDPEFVPDFPSPSAAAQDSLVISTNPLKIICGYGYTYVYQPVFVPTTPAASTSDAIVTVLDSIGGTTNPGPGTYHYINGSTITLQATPDANNRFVQWVAVGADGHPTVLADNPANIVCGYGYTYSYQPMFAPAGSSTNTTTGIPAEYLYAIIVVLAVVAVIGIAAALVFRRRK